MHMHVNTYRSPCYIYRGTPELPADSEKMNHRGKWILVYRHYRWLPLPCPRSAVERFSYQVRKLFPRAPAGRERVIAEHACLKHSGRIGRTAAAKSLDEKAVRLAVAAHVRHAETEYDRLLARGEERIDARAAVGDTVRRVLDKWGPGSP